jgi:hypothetical protein
MWLTSQTTNSSLVRIEAVRPAPPLEELKKEQGALLSAFRAGVEETVSARRSIAGLPLEEAVVRAAL